MRGESEGAKQVHRRQRVTLSGNFFEHVILIHQMFHFRSKVTSRFDYR